MATLRRRSRDRTVLDAPDGVIDLRAAPTPVPDVATKRATGWLGGGGVIVTPPGSCTRSPAATGTATFGLGVQRLDGARAPSGFAAFTFEGGDVAFRAAGFDWLLFVGPIGTAAGWGTLNGAEGYSFKVMVTDGGRTGRSALRMRIWLSATSAVIFDSEPGSRGDTPSSPLVRGSVVALAR